MALPQDEQVRYDVQLNAQAAIQVLKQLLAGIEGTDAKVVAFSTHLVNLSRQWHVPWRDLLNTIRQVNAELSRTGRGGTLFGNIGGRSQDDLLNMSERFLSSAEAAGRLSENVDDVSERLIRGSRPAKEYARSLDVIRIAMGTIVAMALFRAINFIEESMRKAITTAKEFETSLYRLSNVERILSKQGVEVSFSGLRNGILEIKKLLPIFSENDITKQVSLIGIMTKELGYTEKQIIDLAKAIGVLNIRSSETESLTETTNKILTALVAPTGKGTPALGINLGEAAQKAEAVSEGLLKSGESLDKLTEKQKGLIKLNIILKNAGEELINIQEYLDTNTAKLEEASAAWEDLLKSVGQTALPFIPVLTGLFEATLPALDAIRKSLFGITVALGIFFAIARTGFSATIESIKLVAEAMFRLSRGDFKGAADAIGKEFDNIRTHFENMKAIIEEGTSGESVEKLAKRFFPELADAIETPTEKVDDLGDAITELPGLDDLIKDLERLGDRLEELQFQFDLESARDLEDFLRDMERMLEDFARKRQSIIDDANDKTDDANRKHRNKEIDEEARFQEQMRQLREKFLFNLEDALRERDARQVLRLQAQYAIDKKALENEHALRKKENDRQHQEDLERIRKERDDRLKELEEEERIKRERAQEDFELEQKRKAEDHQHDLDQLQQQINDRLMEFARAIGEEFGLNEEGVNALYNLLQQYYGPDGLFSGLYDYSYEYLVSRAQAMLEQVNAIVAAAQAAIASVSGMLGGRIPEAPPRTPSSIPPQAKGGTYFANRPTRTTFGESGPELAMFIPLRGSKGMSGGAPAGMSATNKDGTVDINLWLSPDLESRIVGNTLNETAKVFTKVRRSK